MRVSARFPRSLLIQNVFGSLCALELLDDTDLTEMHVPKGHRKIILNKKSSVVIGQQDSCCPITKEPFVDPLKASDGFVYERRAITQHFSTRDTSPMTNALLGDKTLVTCT